MIKNSILVQLQEGFEKLTGITDFPQEELLKVIGEMHISLYSKGEYFARAGEISNTLSYIQEGLFRTYIIGNDGKEYTKNFYSEGSFMGAQTSLLTGKPSLNSIQALEDSVSLEMDYRFLTQIAEQNMAWQKLFRCTAEQDYLAKEKRESELLLFDAKTRYIHFIEEHPEWAARIKQHYIASYLGITAETLSRIKEQI